MHVHLAKAPKDAVRGRDPLRRHWTSAISVSRLVPLRSAAPPRGLLQCTCVCGIETLVMSAAACALDNAAFTVKKSQKCR